MQKTEKVEESAHTQTQWQRDRQTNGWWGLSAVQPARTPSSVGLASLTPHLYYILFTVIYLLIFTFLFLYYYYYTNIGVYIYIYLFWVNYYLFINGLCFSFPQIFFEFPAESHGESERPNRSSPNPTQPSLSNNIFDQDIYKY